MSSWRHDAAPQTQDDLDELFNLALTHATRMIKEVGALTPFAAAVTIEGGAQVLAGPTDDGAEHGARNRLSLLYRAARGRAEQTRAVAFAADITLEGGRAIRIEAEHRAGIALALRVPYRRGFLGGVKLGTMRMDAGPARVWTAAS